MYKRQLEKLSLAVEYLKENPNHKPTILAIIQLDAEFHRTWACYDPTKIAIMNLVIGNHLQPLLRLASIQNLFHQRGHLLPIDCQPLSNTLIRVYDELQGIFDAFHDADADDEYAKKLVLNTAADHPQDGWRLITDEIELRQEFSRRKTD